MEGLIKRNNAYGDEVRYENGNFGDFQDDGAVNGGEDDVQGLSNEQEKLGDGSG